MFLLCEIKSLVSKAISYAVSTSLPGHVSCSNRSQSLNPWKTWHFPNDPNDNMKNSAREPTGFSFSMMTLSSQRLCQYCYQLFLATNSTALHTCMNIHFIIAVAIRERLLISALSKYLKNQISTTDICQVYFYKTDTICSDKEVAY